MNLEWSTSSRIELKVHYIVKSLIILTKNTFSKLAKPLSQECVFQNKPLSN